MTGFIITTLSIIFTAWIVYAATYRAAYTQGRMDERAERRELDIGVAGYVPPGTPCNCAVPDPCYNGMTCGSKLPFEVYGRHG